MILHRTFTILTITILLFGCSGQKANENYANYKLAREFKIDSINLKYQYYQKYGFTDLCEEIQMVSISEKTKAFEKMLPIEKEDLKLIKPIFPCIDDSIIDLKNNSRNFYADIELDFSECLIDSNLNLRIAKGEYEFTETEFMTTLRIYDAESGLIYLGIRKCDGK